MTAEVGQTYDITIEDEQSNEWTGPQGVYRMEDVEVRIPNAKKGQQFKVEILGIEVNPWTGNKEARYKVL